MNKRPQQLESVIRETVQKCLDRGLQDPRVSGMVTVTSVKVSEDLREATLYVSVMPEDAEKLTLHGLTHAAGFLRKKLGEVIQGRHLPHLHFKIDHQVKKQAAVIDALAKVAAEREALLAQGIQPPSPESAGKPDAPGSTGQESAKSSAAAASTPDAAIAPAGGGWLKRSTQSDSADAHGKGQPQ